MRRNTSKLTKSTCEQNILLLVIATSRTDSVHTCVQRQVWFDRRTTLCSQRTRPVVSFAHSLPSALGNLPINIKPHLLATLNFIICVSKHHGMHCRWVEASCSRSIGDWLTQRQYFDHIWHSTYSVSLAKSDAMSYHVGQLKRQIGDFIRTTVNHFHWLLPT